MVLKLPEGSTLEDTERTLFAAADIARRLPEVTLDPGLCRHRRAVQFQRPGAALLSARSRRSWVSCRSNWRTRAIASGASHADRARPAPALKALALPAGSTLKVVEVPPGPPVLATLLAEIYGPTRRRAAPWPKR